MTEESPQAPDVENALLRSALRTSLQSGNERLTDVPKSSSWPFPSIRLRKTFGRDLPGSVEPRLSLDCLSDTKYANEDEMFAGVLHVFHQRWMGIRAAAGSLPGRKLAIADGAELTRQELADMLGLIGRERISRIVFHGMFEAAGMLIDSLAHAGASHLVHMVFHGNVAQWADRPERALALSAIEAAQAGKIRRIHFMQRGYAIAGRRSFLPMLLNAAPCHRRPFADGSRRGDVAFIPGTDSWRKNLHANAFGAALSPRISRVMHYAPDIRLPTPHGAKLREASYVDRGATFEMMARVGCTLNVSLVECHPMVGLESESVGTPCLRGRLNLDYGEDHEYVRLVQVDDPISPFEISKRLDAVLAVQDSERLAMVKDYAALMCRTSIERYKEFLEL
jgi:hypothetical protein